jgi:uncharacterized protein YbbC (DUF1343 family)
MFQKSTKLSILVLIGCLFLISLTGIQCETKTKENVPAKKVTAIVTGAERMNQYLPILHEKSVALVANQSSLISKTNSSERIYEHLVDSLLSLGINIKAVFAPEHGFRGTEADGAHIEDGKDPGTGVQVISLYGENRKPTTAHLDGVDVVVFDLQDVGARFYTYATTLHYVMEACAENDIPVIILDRPNPNGHYIDGPVMEPEFKSFIGMHPVPIVYGMTIGEYGQMINGEGWLSQGVRCNLTVISLSNYDHQKPYSLPVRPSPNLPNDKAINLYPTLCLFEGTTVSCGRGTEMQFQIFGSPHLPESTYNLEFIPTPNFGSKYPKHEGVLCNGMDLREEAFMNALNFNWLIDAYNASSDKDKFFNASGFAKRAGTDKLQRQIEQGMDFESIRATWQEDLEKFKIIRKKYLIY